MKTKINVLNILLVEDNYDDIVLITKVFEKIQISHKLHILRNGEDALDFLYHRGRYSEEKPLAPSLILLDINIPGMSGFDILKTLKENSKYRRIPVIMLTTSDRDEDIARSYENGACSYITKPTNFKDFVKIMKRFEIYWTLVSKTPE